MVLAPIRLMQLAHPMGSLHMVKHRATTNHLVVTGQVVTGLAVTDLVAIPSPARGIVLAMVLVLAPTAHPAPAVQAFRLTAYVWSMAAVIHLHQAPLAILHRPA